MNGAAESHPPDEGHLHRRSNDYGKLPARLMHDIEITDGAVRLYAHMHWRYGSNGDNHEGRGSMAIHLGVSEATISNRIHELEARQWVVTIERGYEPTTGKYQTPFYHVFELQEDCQRFRQNYVPKDGERLRPKPAKPRRRKSRAGIGGNPKILAGAPVASDLNPSNSSCAGEILPSDTVHPSNSSCAVQSNSSCAYPDSVDPERKDSAPVGAGAPVPAPSVPETPRPEAAPVLTLVEERSDGSAPAAQTQTPPGSAPPPSAYALLFAAVVEHVFGISDPAELKRMDAEAQVGSRAGKIASWLAGNKDRFRVGGGRKESVLGFISRPAEPEHVRAFAGAYRAANPGADVPRDIEKFVEHWRKWASQRRGRVVGQVTAPPVPPVPVRSDADWRQIEADAAAVRRALAAGE